MNWLMLIFYCDLIFGKMAAMQYRIVELLYFLDIYCLFSTEKKAKKYNRETHKKAERGFLSSSHLKPSLEKKMYF